MMSFVVRIIKTCVHILYPSTCISCGTYDLPLCNRCRKPYLQTHKRTSEGFYGCASYSDFLLRSLIVTLKQKPSTQIAHVCAILIHNCIISEIIKTSVTTISVIPLPRTGKKLQKIGHDQMNIICQELVDILKKKNFSANLYKSTLKNTSNTEHHKLTKIKRIAISKSQFIFTHQKPPRDSLIILCDDIITSGSTMRAAYDLFTKDGYHSIVGVSLLIKE